MALKYTIRYYEEVVTVDIPSLPKDAKKIIVKAIEERLMIDPIGFGKPLAYSLKGHRRLRVSNYLIIYRLSVEAFTVIIVAIKHRKEVYKSCS